MFVTVVGWAVPLGSTGFSGFSAASKIALTLFSPPANLGVAGRWIVGVLLGITVVLLSSITDSVWGVGLWGNEGSLVDSTTFFLENRRRRSEKIGLELH